MTRVDANELVDELMSGIDFNRDTAQESKCWILHDFSVQKKCHRL